MPFTRQHRGALRRRNCPGAMKPRRPSRTSRTFSAPSTKPSRNAGARRKTPAALLRPGSGLSRKVALEGLAQPDLVGAAQRVPDERVVAVLLLREGRILVGDVLDRQA